MSEGEEWGVVERTGLLSAQRRVLDQKSCLAKSVRKDLGREKPTIWFSSLSLFCVHTHKKPKLQK